MQAQSTPCELITFSTPSHPIPMTWTEAFREGINCGSAIGFSNATSMYYTVGPASFLADQTSFEPWMGYWLLLKTAEDVTIHFPAMPET
jgi:hypothetical protein